MSQTGHNEEAAGRSPRPGAVRRAGSARASFWTRDQRERLVVVILMLLIAVPLGIYFRLAVSVSRERRDREATARGRAAADIVARMVDANRSAAMELIRANNTDDPLTYWLLDREGTVVSPQGFGRPKQFARYAPFTNALSGQIHAIPAPAPDDNSEAIVGYAPTTGARQVVLAVQHQSDIHQPEHQLILLLSFLLAPVLTLLLPTVWILVGMYQRERRMAHQLSDQNDRLRKIDELRAGFLATVSHDLRTPLAAVQLSLTGLLDTPAEPDRDHVRATLHGASEEVDRLNARVRNLLDMARLEAAPGPARTDIADLTDIVGEALSRVRPMTAGRPIEADFPPGALLVECDQAQIETVVINLIENALKYSPPGSPIRLRGEHLAGQVILTVTDHGPGVHPGDEERVFERFYRAPSHPSQPGTGLGLAICRSVVEWHDGRIGVRAARGGGAAFWFSLPALQFDQAVVPDLEPVDAESDDPALTTGAPAKEDARP